MGRLTTSLVSSIALLLQQTVVVRASLWTVDIDQGPAPSPQDGPPFSAHATRNRALLPGQICGIVFAYVGTVVIIGGLLLTVGRRLRKEALSVYRIPSLEMVKPPMAFDNEPEPTSPVSQRSWYSPRRLKKNSVRGSLRSDTNLGSPVSESNASFDPSVLEADRAAREQELEDLYAAALAQEASKSQFKVTQVAVPLEDGASPPRNGRRPPRLLTTALSNAHLNAPSSNSPNATRSPIRAIYPPDSPAHGYAPSPISSIRADYLTTPLTPRYPPSPAPQPSPGTPPGPRFSGSSSLRSQTSGHNGKRLRKTLRNLHISNPIPISPGNSSDQEARTPLSPRYYIDPGVPPSPPTRSEAPTTPATYKSSLYDDEQDQFGGTRPDSSIAQIRDVPLAAPQRIRTPSTGDQQLQHQRPSTAATVAVAATSTSTLGTLPFRALSNQHHQQQQQQSRIPHTPSSASAFASASASTSAAQAQSATATGLQSPSLITKTTYLERRRDDFSLLNPGIRTGQALPTPYSPYMPFTPITPVTPRLMSKADIKKKRKDEGRWRRAPAEEDAVLEEDEIWGS